MFHVFMFRPDHRQQVLVLLTWYKRAHIKYKHESQWIMIIIYHYKRKGKSLNSAVSNFQDCSKRFTLYSLADLFNRTPFRLLGAAASHAAINTRRLFVHKYVPLSAATYSLLVVTHLKSLHHQKCYRTSKLCPKYNREGSYNGMDTPHATTPKKMKSYSAP